jgi:hypothetical protein
MPIIFPFCTDGIFHTKIARCPAPSYTNEWASSIFTRVMTYHQCFLMTEEVHHLPNQGAASDPLPSGSTVTLPTLSERKFKENKTVKLSCSWQHSN